MNEVIESLERAGVPQHYLAAFELLQFHSSPTDRLDLLPDEGRRQFLDWCDHRQLTLLLTSMMVPDWVKQQIVPKRARYEQRYERLKQQLFEIVDAFNAEGLEFVMVKGLSHAPALTPDAVLRAQGDIDFWLRGSDVYKAQEILSCLGYVRTLKAKSRHLSPMARPSIWKWRGDVFDSEMPIPVELHYELWSDDAEYVAVSKLDEFWDRKQLRDFDGHKINVLCDADLLGFAALHLMLHLLHGEVLLQRAWEIARFLDTHVEDDPFWTSWSGLHPADLRIIEVCIFSLLTKWFGCQLRLELQQLPASVQAWLADFSLAPLTNEWVPNKAEIWLHFAFIRGRADKARVLFRRVVPTSRFLSSRLRHHFVTFVPTVFQGLRWLMSSR